jgi:hypothetical protein
MTGVLNSWLSTTQLFSQRLRDFNYDPITDWSHLFSPTVNFGCNIEDAPIEEKVLNGVGSYGMQLNRISDVLMVLLSQLHRGQLSPAAAEAVRQFETMATRADECAAKAQGKAQSPLYVLSANETEQMVDRKLRALRPKATKKPVEAASVSSSK